MKTFMLLAATTLVACGYDPKPADVREGATSSGGLQSLAATLDCQPYQLADGGFKALVNLGQREGVVHLTKISIRGSFPIEEGFAVVHTLEDQVLTVSGESLDLTLSLGQDHLPGTSDTWYYGRLKVKADLDWSPKDHAIMCQIRRDSPVPDAERALRLSMFGIGPAVDGIAFAAMKRLIADLIADGSLKTYRQLGTGIEGGESACIELSDFTRVELADVERRFLAIRPDANTTSYAVERATNCQED